MMVTDQEREVMDSPFARFRDRVVAGGVVTDADVNEVIVRRWYHRLSDWVMEVFFYD